MKYFDHICYLLQEILLRDARTAADWCRNRNWDGEIQFPSVLSLEKDQQIACQSKLQSWMGDYTTKVLRRNFSLLYFGKKMIMIGVLHRND